MLLSKFRGSDVEIKNEREREREKDHWRQIGELLATRVTHEKKSCQDYSNTAMEANVWTSSDVTCVIQRVRMNSTSTNQFF